MRFFNEIQRNKHPQACLIPEIVWSEIFSDNVFPNVLISWMSMPYEVLKKQLTPAIDVEKNKAWIAIVLSHPTLNNQQLIELGDMLGLCNSELLNLVVMLSNNTNHLELLKQYSQKEFSERDTFSVVENYALRIQRVAKLGYLNTLESLIGMIEPKVTKNQLQDIMTHYSCAAFCGASEQGHLDVLKFLETKVPEKLPDMIEATNYYAFRWAAKRGHLAVLRYLESKMPEKLQDMIKAGSFCAFRFAASQGYLEILKYLQEKAPDKMLKMLKTNTFIAFQLAVLKGHLPVVQYMLSYFSVFAYAEAHQQEYGERCVWPFVSQTLTVLRAQQQETEANHLDAVFDVVSAAEAKLLFYIARNLIRRNDTTLIDDLRFLLNIPSVKALAHTEVTPNQSNELLRLALSAGNQQAASVLLNIPAVRLLAEQNNYYREEQQGRLDLAALAADRESSMTALTQGEQQQLQAVTDRYQPLLHQAGVALVMMDLRTTLQAHYEAHPATLLLQKNGCSEELILPMAWSDFTALHLAPEQKTQALTAYYQNKAHTAWRYLAKPNPWMHEHAGYVYINDEHTERWSTFEEYQSLISLLYLAVLDKETPCIDDYTFATRLEHFIEELAHIGRAHNWDKSRRKNNGQLEQYDDLEGDRPSCYSGVKRRLFQSVLGHPLLKLVTEDVIKAELNEFLVTHFKKAIQSNNGIVIKEAWDKGIEGESLSEEDMKILQGLNVSGEQQQDFKNYLSHKYGSSFSASLILLINKAFELTSTMSSHLFKHGGLMAAFFAKLEITEKQKEGYSQNPNRFFGGSVPESPNSESLASVMTAKR
ncbi:ankyrin repeat domain-containing protein [Legionella cincinnatiensis]|uniref:Ankyrin repeat protein n=1 Tax=Legionella cincinnatiensis TaxID=28085 RepID=A0A378IE64_9GAMM|nr:ankyrin repeat domain-containing protein [Legionella cincinnatiensis]KTC92178.1 ankyrin repeat protein [Legionella cincinnatiensis]STX33517.1 ankyrin repeat protein [Legionella cincinnatiensis]